MVGHISDLNIDTYRGIKSLELKNLSTINIITGDNNCGKTSLLEVLKSFSSPADFKVWKTLIRKELNDPRNGLSYYEGFYDLFDINQEDKVIKYNAIYKKEKIQIEMKAQVLEEEILETEYMNKQGISYKRRNDDDLDNVMNVKKMLIDIYVNDCKVSEDSIYEGQLRYIVNSKPMNTDDNNIIYISPARHTTGAMYLNAILDNSEMYEQMLAVLKEYDDDIISINYDNTVIAGSTKGVYKILTKSHKKALPLNVYGDGMKKAVLLMSAVIAAKDGILLIDEFETAIHTSAMNKTFSWIIDMCIKFNVQIFVTSHSKEAIDKLLKCSPKYIDSIAVYTLSKRENGTMVRRLAGDKAIDVQDNMGLELR